MKQWVSVYDPTSRKGVALRTKRRANRVAMCMLDLAEDDVPEHRITFSTVIMVSNGIIFWNDDVFREFAKKHRIRIINQGVVPDGIAITCGSRKEAAKFRLLWDDPRWDCRTSR